MTHGEIDPTLRPPQPFDVEPLDPSRHPEAAEIFASQNFTKIYEYWKDPNTLSVEIRQKAVELLTRPANITFDAYPKESQSDLLSIDPDRRLREELREQPAMADEIYRGILAWYTHCSNIDSSEESMAKLQVEYQELMLEIMPLVEPENRENLVYLYPTVGSLAVKHGLVDYKPTAQIIKDPEISQGRKKMLINNWISQIKPMPGEQTEQAADMQTQAYSWLAEFAEEWSGETSADPELITKIISSLENYAEDSSSPYLNPASIGKVAAHITDDDIRYRFAVRHILYRQEDKKGVPELTNEHKENDSILVWMHEKVSRQLNRHDFIWLRKAPVSQEDLDLQARIEECLPARPVNGSV